MRVLITGSAGFIGYHVSKALLKKGCKVLGYDNLNDYYNVSLKKKRLSFLKEDTNFCFIKGNILDDNLLRSSWLNFAPTHVIHLAAQAGIRYSLLHPKEYIKSNILGFQNVLDLVKETQVKNFIYASSSSIYGKSTDIPFKEDGVSNYPLNIYAVTKMENELAANCYSNLFKIPSTGLRFFTVYGEYDRPDMAMFKFSENIYNGKPITVFNHGDLKRDYTYVGDIVSGILAALDRPAIGEVYNLGNGNPICILDMITMLSKHIGKKANLEYLPMQKGDMKLTYANISKAQRNLNYIPQTSFEVGLKRYVKWYLSYKNEK